MKSSMSTYDKILVAGSTGRTGREIVRRLIQDKNKKVRILVRNLTKAKEVFKDIYEQIEKVYECEFGRMQLLCVFDPQNYGDAIEGLEWCDALIDAIGAGVGEDPQRIEYISTVELIKLCESTQDKFKDKTFVYLSSSYVTRPFTCVSYVLNSVVPYVLGWKALAENKLRQSDLSYLIVRPGELLNTQEIVQKVGVYQGDRVRGKISRKNVAGFILHAIGNERINTGKMTVDVIETKSKVNAKMTEVEIIASPLKEDTEADMIVSDHFKTTRNISVVIYGLMVCLLVFLIYLWK